MNTSLYNYYLHNTFIEQYAIPTNDEQVKESRKLAAVMLPCRLTLGIADTFIGGISGLFSVCTGGYLLANLSQAHLKDSANTLNDCVFSLLVLANPKAKRYTKYTQHTQTSLLKGAKEKLDEYVKEALNSHNIFIRELGSRAINLLTIAHCAVMRITEVFIGVIAAFAAVYYRGEDEELNCLALESLRIFGIANDSIEYLLKTINPCYMENQNAVKTQ